MSRGPASDEYPAGQNRLECRTCPYEFLINQRYFERKEMRRKEVDDVLGGPAEWANVDKTEGTGSQLLAMRTADIFHVLIDHAKLIIAVQCTRENCNSDQAYFRQHQIRSADEPMTIFYRVR